MAKPNTQGEQGEKAQKAPGPFAVLSPVNGDAIAALTDEQRTALGVDENGAGLFRLVGEYVGKTSKQAIGQAVAAHGGGTYVAIPKRSFTPRSVESVGVPRLKWS